MHAKVVFLSRVAFSPVVERLTYRDPQCRSRTSSVVHCNLDSLHDARLDVLSDWFSFIERWDGSSFHVVVPRWPLTKTGRVSLRSEFRGVDDHSWPVASGWREKGGEGDLMQTSALRRSSIVWCFLGSEEDDDNRINAPLPTLFFCSCCCLGAVSHSFETWQGLTYRDPTPRSCVTLKKMAHRQ